jgi:cytosine/creatinine deaminase
VEHGRIAAIAPAGSATEGPSLDCGQLWPGLVDGHTHLDKGHILPRRPNPTGDFIGALEPIAVQVERYPQ